MPKQVSKDILKRITKAGDRFFASDNIAKHLRSGDREKLIEELTPKFEDILRTLLIDVDNDPNSMDTGKRLAKMYINELFSGRYEDKPPVASFPNDSEEQSTRFTGLLNVRAEITSVCSHHHQPVRGLCFIGLIPSTHVIGLSKYARIAKWCARRGTLQEELANEIMRQIKLDTKTEDVGVYIQATHGCMENRGVCAHNSLTQTTVLSGQFYNPGIKDEWMKYIQMQLQTKV